MTTHLLFGYGSLINADSRAKTGQSGPAIPVLLQGIQRQWNLVVPSAQLTALGAVWAPDSRCNGVLVPVPEEELPKFDARELPFGYSRKELDRKTLRPYTHQRLPDGPVWAYVTPAGGPPTREQPIVQSYLDVVLIGCLLFGEKFARDFIATTDGWQAPWVNDRQQPRCPRAMAQVPLAGRIDALLRNLVPDAFQARLEP